MSVRRQYWGEHQLTSGLTLTIGPTQPSSLSYRPIIHRQKHAQKRHNALNIGEFPVLAGASLAFFKAKKSQGQVGNFRLAKTGLVWLFLLQKYRVVGTFRGAGEAPARRLQGGPTP